MLTLCLSLSQSWYLVSLVKSLNINCHRGQQEMSLWFELVEKRMSLTDSPGVSLKAVDILSKRHFWCVAHFPFLLQPCSPPQCNYSSSCLYGFKSQTVGQQIQMIHKCSFSLFCGEDLIRWNRSYVISFFPINSFYFSPTDAFWP